MKHIKKLNEYMIGPGGYLPTEHSSEEMFNYRIQELDTIKNMLIEKKEVIINSETNMNKLGEHINMVHELLNTL